MGRHERAGWHEGPLPPGAWRCASGQALSRDTGMKQWLDGVAVRVLAVEAAPTVGMVVRAAHHLDALRHQIVVPGVDIVALVDDEAEVIERCGSPPVSCLARARERLSLPSVR